jgi:hypothetical protein
LLSSHHPESPAKEAHGPGLLGLGCPCFLKPVVGHPWFPVNDANVLHMEVLHTGEIRIIGTPAARATSLPHLVLIRAFLFILPPAWAMFKRPVDRSLLALAQRASPSPTGPRLSRLFAWPRATAITLVLNGMETGLAMAALAWALALAVPVRVAVVLAGDPYGQSSGRS